MGQVDLVVQDLHDHLECLEYLDGLMGREAQANLQRHKTKHKKGKN